MNEPDTHRRPASPRTSNNCSSGILVHIVTDDASTMQDELENAVRTLRVGVSENPQGIMITRHSEALFTVTHSPEVPYGTTLEQDRWHRHP